MPESTATPAPHTWRFGVPGFFLLLASLFLLANRGAYQGFFQGDELDSLGWAPLVPAADFAKVFLRPLVDTGNFRPVGHLYFRLMNQAFGLHFPPYLVPIHLLHLLNVWLLWTLLRRLGASRFAAATGAVFFAFQVAVLDVYWKPMYVFDLLCATFSLVSILLWIERRWLLSFAALWLAYKSKELAVMLPAVLLCYEFWLGKCQWKPLLPFLAVALSFGLQGILLQAGRGPNYSLQFTFPAIASSSAFYAGKLFAIPLAGFGVLALPFLSRDRRVWLGIAATVLFFVPLLLLPLRLFSAYWYAPLIGVAVAVGALADGRLRLPVTVAVAGCLLWSCVQLPAYAKEKLAQDAATRSYVAQLQGSATRLRGTPVFLYFRLPDTLHPWGLQGMLNYLWPGTNARAYSLQDPAADAFLQSPTVATLSWDPLGRHLWISRHTPNTLDASYVTADLQSPFWQLTHGWYLPDEDFRWIAPHATARLYRPAQATRFEVTCVAAARLIQTQGHAELRALMNGGELGIAQLTERGVRTLSWPLPDHVAGPVDIDFDVQPAFHAPGDPRVLGIGIERFGFR